MNLSPPEDIIARVSEAKQMIEKENNKDDFTEDGALRIKSIFEYLEDEVSYEELKRALVFVSSPS